jgi:hypothetical protein
MLCSAGISRSSVSRVIKLSSHGTLGQSNEPSCQLRLVPQNIVSQKGMENRRKVLHPGGYVIEYAIFQSSILSLYFIHIFNLYPAIVENMVSS